MWRSEINYWAVLLLYIPAYVKHFTLLVYLKNYDLGGSESKTSGNQKINQKFFFPGKKNFGTCGLKCLNNLV